jgi:hypothetical protein
MSYYLQAFICKRLNSNVLTNNFDMAKEVELGQGLTLIPMTEELFDQINNFVESNSVDSFEYLTENIESKVLAIIGETEFAYVEAEYHGGQGGQIAVIWKDGKRLKFLPYDQERINQVLKYFGIVAANGQDEFLTCGIGLRRNTIEWVGETY